MIEYPGTSSVEKLDNSALEVSILCVFQCMDSSGYDTSNYVIFLSNINRITSR